MITKRNPIFRRFAWVGVATALVLAVPFASAQEEKQPQHQLSEKVSEALQKQLKPLQDAKNYPGMLELINGLLKTVPPTSYDAANLLDMKAITYLQLSDNSFTQAIEPWEQALKLSKQFRYFDRKKELDITKYVAQFIFVEATSVKDKAKQSEAIVRSSTYLKEYLERAPKPEPDVQMLYAQILYFQATADDPAHPNMQMLKDAQKVVQQSMVTMIRPKEGHFMILLAILSQMNDNVQASEIMELLLKQYPNKKDVWPMLFGTYVNLANSVKAESKQQREYYVRAINTLERAQALGFMNTPRDNYNLFTLYVSAGETSLATDLLYNGMKKGTIESTPNNWRVLGAYYQQANKELQAINALKEATQLFPKDGTLEVLIGQIYQQMERTKDANEHLQRAVKKGNLGEKPHQAYLFLSYTSFELGDLDGALAAIKEAAKTPDGAKDAQVKSLREGIENALQDRDNAKKAAAGTPTKKL